MANINLKNVIKRYGKLEVVHGINLDIEHNEFIVLVGPSGCGKSTTLRMIAGLEDISDGSIIIGDREVNDLPPRKRNISMVFQNYALYPHMSVRENLGFGLKIAGLAQEDIDARVNHAAEILELEALMARSPAELSGGQRQRVAMGRAIVRHPDAFLFDEPLSNLDAKLRVQMRTEITKLHQKVKTTVVYVTHDQVEAMTLADRIVIMKDGYIEQVGAPVDVFNQPANTFVASFIGSPPMNLLPAKIKGQMIDFGDGIAIPVPKSYRGKVVDGVEYTIGIRPDYLTYGSLVDDKLGQIEKITLTVELAELLGAETLLYTRLNGKEVLGKMFNHVQINLGSALEFSLAIDKIHIFDSESGMAIV